MATAPIRERKTNHEPQTLHERLSGRPKMGPLFIVGTAFVSSFALIGALAGVVSWLSVQQEPLVVSAPKPQPVRREVVLADRVLAETIEALRRTVPAAKSVRVCGDSTGRFIATIWGLPEQDLLLGTGSSMHAAVADLDARRKRLMMGLAGYMPPDQTEP